MTGRRPDERGADRARMFPAPAGAAGQAPAPAGTGQHRRFARRSTSCRSARWCGTGRGGSSATWRRRISSSRKAGSSGRSSTSARSGRTGEAGAAVDISGSMRVGTKAVDARQAARHLFGALQPGDEAAVFAFDTGLRARHGRSPSDLAALEASLGKRRDALRADVALRRHRGDRAGGRGVEGRRRGRLPQRSAVVVITDGIDTRSRLTPEQVASIASEIDVPVYIVAVMATDRRPARARRRPARARPVRCTNLARWTGGELFMASAPAHASVAARQIVGRAAASVRARLRSVDPRRVGGRWKCARATRT